VETIRPEFGSLKTSDEPWQPLEKVRKTSTMRVETVESLGKFWTMIEESSMRDSGMMETV
jgi:hypothetical protein